VLIFLNSGSLNFLEPQDLSRPVTGLLFIPSVISLLDSVTFGTRKIFVGKILYLVLRLVHRILESDC